MSILHSSVVHLTDLVVARSIIGCAARHGNASRYKLSHFSGEISVKNILVQLTFRIPQLTHITETFKHFCQAEAVET